MTESQRNRLSSWVVGTVGLLGALALLPSPTAFILILVAQLLLKMLRANLASGERPIDLLGHTQQKLFFAYLFAALLGTLWVALRHPEVIEAAIDNMYGFFAFMCVVFLPILLVTARQEWALFLQDSEYEP